MECGPYVRLSNAIEEAARSVAMSNGRRKRPPWFEMLKKNKIMRLIKNRDTAHISHKESPTEESRQTLHLRNRALTTAKAMAKVKWLELKLNKIESINEDPLGAWKSIKEINAGFSGPHEKAAVMKMRNEYGTFAKTEADNSKVLFDHIHKVVNRKELSAFNPPILFQEIDSRPTNNALDSGKCNMRKSQTRTGYPQKPSRTSREPPYWRSRNSLLCSGKKTSSTPLTDNRSS
jgi:hypothetical protein